MKSTTKIAVWTLTILLASLFISAGAALLSPALAEALKRQGFPDWLRFGPDWLRFGIGATWICAALILLVPRVSWYAAGILCVPVAAFLMLDLWRGNVFQAGIAATVLVLVGFTGYLRHPRTFYMSRLRAAVDQVAEREIAAGQQRAALRKVGMLNDSAIVSP
jgi:hypothetical protein